MSEVELECADDMDLKESNMIVSHDGSCHFSDMTPLKGPLTVIVPESLVRKMRSIESKHSSALEFGAFLKGNLSENGILIVTEDFLVLKQEVTGATIDFKENPPLEFNGVIHRHPTGCNGFSCTDDKSINRNHEFSLLYVNNTITKGVINLRTENGFIFQTELVVQIEYLKDENLDLKNILKNIKSHSPLRLASSSTGMDNNLQNLQNWKNNKNFLNSLNHIHDDIPTFDDGIEEDEELWELGQGFYYDGISIVDENQNYYEVHQIPRPCQEVYQEILLKEGGIG